jgi:hypothetical protein
MKTTNLQAPWGVIVSQHSNQKPSAWEIITKYGGVIAETNSLTNDTIPRLISATPDMFQALQAIVDAFGDQNSLLIDQCKAALAKAKGEA